MEGARDPRAKEGYARALDQQRQKAKVFEELSARRERIDAQLEGLEKTLETASAQVIRIKSAEGDLANAEGARIAESLDALAVEMDAAAETVDEAAAFEHVAGAPTPNKTEDGGSIMRSFELKRSRWCSRSRAVLERPRARLRARRAIGPAARRPPRPCRRAGARPRPRRRLRASRRRTSRSSCW